MNGRGERMKDGLIFCGAGLAGAAIRGAYGKQRG